MTVSFRIKRRTSGATGAPSSLLNGELAFNETDYTLYYGFGIGAGQNAASVIPVAGKGAFMDLSTTQTIAGAKTFSAAPVTSATIASNQNDGTLATTAWVTSKSYISGNQTITISGDVSGSGTTAITLTLATVNSAVGTFAGFTVNAKGQITNVTLPTTLAGYGITDGVKNLGGTPSLQTGLLSARPAAGTTGRRWYATDTQAESYDNGTAWVNMTPAITGDISISAGGTTATLPSIATAGSYFNVTINAKGQVTSGTNPTTLSGFGITDAVKNNGSVTGIQAGTLASRPAFGSAGRKYIATDVNCEYYDTGSAWILLEGAVTGDVTIPAGGSTATLPTINGNVGTFTKITVNGKGQVTAATNLVAGDIPNIATSQVTGLQSFVNATTLNSFAAPTTSVSMNSQNITNLLDPVNPQDAATKNYVDAARQGLSVKQACRVGSASNISISAPGTTIDSVTMASGDRVLLFGQTTASQNGIWVWNGSAVAMTRATDADGHTTDGFSTVAEGLFTFVAEGATNAGSGYVLTTPNPITVGTTSLTFTQFSGAGEIVAGNGLTKSGNTLAVNPKAGGGITVDGTGVYISATYAGQTSITTLGTITAGTWQGTIIAAAYGGLGANASAFSGYLSMSSGVATASTTIPNTAITGLGTMSTQSAGAVAITGGTIDGITFDGGTF